MANQPALRWEALDERLLKDIYDSDQAIYPAPELTYSRLRSWVDAYPELCLSLRSGPSAWGANTLSDDTTNTTVHASIIVLPLQQPFWDMLRRADISEHDVDSESMFPPLEDSGVHAREEKFEVGLHVFHIERSPSFATVWKGAKFTVLALEEIRRRVPRIFKSWDVVGYTALTASKQGSAAFKRLGFTPSHSEAGSSSLLSDEAEMVERRGNEPFFGMSSSDP